MSTVLQIYEAIDRLAPFSLSMDFDNTGILVGDRQKKVGRALLALDCTKEVLRQAKELGAQLIITHHPIIFHPIKRVNEDSLVYHLLRSDIAVISAHTNLDIAQGGVNDLLAKRIGLSDCRGLQPMDAQGTFFLGRVGSLPEGMEPQQFAQYLKQRLGAPSVKFAAADRTVKTVALCGGAEVKQHEYLAAAAAGISIFDAGHFDTEDVVIEPLWEYLTKQFADVEFFTTHHTVIRAV